MTGVAQGMKDCSDFERVISIPRWSEPRDVSKVPQAEEWAAFLASAPSHVAPPPFTRVDFHDPYLIYYSSGTTGIPKAIVHAVGNITISLLKEARLHENLGPDSAGLQYTTTGWIMYLANVSQLLYGSRAVMYDGSPFQPDAKAFIRILEEQKVTKFGTSPRWMAEVANQGISPREIADLSSLRIVTTTGMVLSDQQFEWFYDAGFPKHVHLANISGGTDIAGRFGGENPLSPLYVGGTQGPSLGIPVAIYDAQQPDGPGKPVPDGEPGELVATGAFPNIPVFLWGDKTPTAPEGEQISARRTYTAPEGSRYHSAYFARFNNVWAHGDFCIIDPQTGNLSFLGRADGVLNPSGVRFGSAEIYAVLDRNFSDRVQDSLCVGQRRPGDTDESVMLFLLMQPGHKFDRALVTEVKAAIQKALTKRHVPRWIFETPEIPVSGAPGHIVLRFKLTMTDHGQPEEGRAPGEADRVGWAGEAERHAAEPAELRVLLPIRQGRRPGGGKGQVIDRGDTEKTCRFRVWEFVERQTRAPRIHHIVQVHTPSLTPRHHALTGNLPPCTPYLHPM